MQFLLERERAYIGAGSLFEKLARLGVDPVLYMLPLPYIFKPDELRYFVESIRNDLLGKQKGEDYDYVRQVCAGLMSWADREYIVHVI